MAFLWFLLGPGVVSSHAHAHPCLAGDREGPFEPAAPVSRSQLPPVGSGWLLWAASLYLFWDQKLQVVN